MKDFKDMEAFAYQKVRESQAIDPAKYEGDPAVSILQEAVFTVLSRPDNDNMVSKVLGPLRRELKRFKAYMKTLNNIIDISINGLGDSSQNIKRRATYIIVLQNLMAEVKPQIKENEKTKAIFQKIYQKKVKVPKDVSSDLEQSMTTAISPSEVAHLILQRNFPEEYPKEKPPWWKFW